MSPEYPKDAVSEISSPDLPVIFLMGPTASGKTALAIELVQSGGYEIISVDSAMVYQQLDIGSAKPTDQEILLAPHHLIDFIDPKEAYSAADFCRDARELINQIHGRGKTPLLVGGTMLYFKALKQGLADLPAADEKVRAGLSHQLNQRGIAALHQELAQVDPQTAERLHTNDTQRILRALEVFQVSGKALSLWHAEQTLSALPNPVLSIALAPEDRSQLHKKIEARFDSMIKQGLLDEVASLYYRGDLDLDCPAMKSVGYRQIWQYLAGELKLSEAIERAVIATRQLAKRQYTWLRSWPEVEWFDPQQPLQLKAVTQRIAEFVNAHSKQNSDQQSVDNL